MAIVMASHFPNNRRIQHTQGCAALFFSFSAVSLAFALAAADFFRCELAELSFEDFAFSESLSEVLDELEGPGDDRKP